MLAHTSLPSQSLMLFLRIPIHTAEPCLPVHARILNILEGQALDKETAVLDKFYASVRERASGIDNAEGKQKIIWSCTTNSSVSLSRIWQTASASSIRQLRCGLHHPQRE